MKFIRFTKPVKFAYKPIGETVEFKAKDITLLDTDVANNLIKKGFAESDAVLEKATKNYGSNS